VLGDFKRKYAIKVLRGQRRKNRARERGKKSVRYGKEVQRVLEVDRDKKKYRKTARILRRGISVIVPAAAVFKTALSYSSQGS
jgi:hypothetical protein